MEVSRGVEKRCGFKVVGIGGLPRNDAYKSQRACRRIDLVPATARLRGHEKDNAGWMPRSLGTNKNCDVLVARPAEVANSIVDRVGVCFVKARL